TMKKTIILTLVMAMATIGAFAQETAAPAAKQAALTVEQKAKKQTDKLSAIVNLTPDQYQKVMDINKDFITKREALRSSGTEMTDEQIAQNKTLAKEREQKIMALLTPAQKKAIDAAKEEKKENKGM
ncbi:MAG TPA: hypothetical protein VG603_11765, partial [Chitinophagales bacterium]|nr:hypothetical protein [Chitinophagales bacterium]